jgi:hypothetical protein
MIRDDPGKYTVLEKGLAELRRLAELRFNG